MKLLAMLFICTFYIGWSLTTQRAPRNVKFHYTEKPPVDTKNDPIIIDYMDSTAFWDMDYDQWAHIEVHEN